MLLGDSGVGKTCLLVRFKDGAFLSGAFISTVGIDYRVRCLFSVLSLIASLSGVYNSFFWFYRIKLLKLTKLKLNYK